MRILHVVSSIGVAYGGPPKVAIDLCSALAAIEGFSIELLSTASGNEQVHTVPREVISHIFRRSALSVAWEGHAWGLSRFLKENIRRYDIVHVHELWSYPQFVASRLALQYGIPLVVSPQGHLDPAGLSQSVVKKRLFSRLHLDKVMRGAAAIVVLNKREISYASGFINQAHNRIVVIPNGLHPLAHSKKNTITSHYSRPYILFLSRIHPRKGVMELLQAFAECPQQAEYDLVIGGSFSSSKFEAELRQFVAERKLTEKVHFPGIVFGESKTALLSNAAALALTSYSEGIPTIVLDALQVGCPLFISDNCGIDDYLESEGVAIVTRVNKEDILRNLAVLCRQAHILKQQACIRGPQIIDDHFSIAKIAVKYQKLYAWIQQPDDQFVSRINQEAI